MPIGDEVSTARAVRGSSVISPISAPLEFRLIADSAPVPMWLTGLDRKRRFVNRAYAEFLGMSYEQALEFDWRDVIHPDDVDRIVAESVAGEATLKPFALNGRFRDRRGEWRWLHTISQPSFDQDGVHDGFSGAAFDLTEAREAEQRLRLATEGAGIGTWDWDLRRGLGTWSPEAQRILGVDRGTDISLEERMNAVFPPDREAVTRALAESWTGAGEFALEYRVQRPDGAVRWVASRGVMERNAKGRHIRALGTLRDITERREAQERLEELNHRLESTVAERTRERNAMWRLSRDLLLVLDPRLRIVSINPMIEELTGYPAEDVIGRPFVDFLHPNDRAAIAAAIHRGRRERVEDVEARVICSDGDIRQFVWSAAPEAGLAFVSGRDVSDERARQAELADAQDALRQAQKLEAIGQLTGGVAHDFNNLLSPIIGGLDILRRRGVGGEREQRLIDGALQSAERAKLLVQRLLAFARRQPLQVRGVELAPLLDGLRGLLASTLGPQVEVQIVVVPDLAAVQADSNQLEMAILNLAVNARDAMPEGGTLRIEASNETNASGEALVELSVCDTGVGMDEATLARAVEPFFSSKGLGKGTGLGLSMVEGLTAQLGGSLRIASRPGEGTTVTLCLPATAPVPQATMPLEPRAAQDVRGRILLVDDEPLVRIGTAEALRDEGYEVDEADGGEQALACAERTAYDCVVTDYLMPGLNGVELARALRGRQADLPILLLSGYADPEVFSELPYLSKPCFGDDLVRAVSRLTAARVGGDRSVVDRLADRP